MDIKSKLHGRAALFALAGMGVLAAALALIQIWWDPFSSSFFLRTLATLVIGGIMVGFIAVIDLDAPNAKTRLRMGVLAALCVAGGVLMILQMWFDLLPEELFIKALGSLAVLALLDGVLIVLAEDLGQNKELKDKNYLD